MGKIIIYQHHLLYIAAKRGTGEDDSEHTEADDDHPGPGELGASCGGTIRNDQVRF